MQPFYSTELNSTSETKSCLCRAAVELPQSSQLSTAVARRLKQAIECISRDLKVPWIAQKVFSMHLEGNRRWVPLFSYLQPIKWHFFARSDRHALGMFFKNRASVLASVERADFYHELGHWTILSNPGQIKKKG